MLINVKYLENLKLQANFDDYSIMSDQPVRYHGDGMAPGPFDYFLASSVLCAAYFVKIYCKARDIDTTDIKVNQNNHIDPNNRYKQDLDIQIELPESVSKKDREGIIASMERCTVKRVIQNGINFKITARALSEVPTQDGFEEFLSSNSETYIYGKDKSLECSLKNFINLLTELGIKLEIASWRNPLPHVWSVHLRDADSPLCYTNGKGSTKEAALCSALGEFVERLATNYFYADYAFPKELNDFVHHPGEKWFVSLDDSTLLNDKLRRIYNPSGELETSHLIDANSGSVDRGICALPFEKLNGEEVVFIPVNILNNLYVSNGMSAGNTLPEAQVQALCEIFERAVKNQVIREELSLPDIPPSIIEQYPEIKKGIEALENKGFPIVAKDASLGGRFPVLCLTLLNPHTGGAFASFGSHPSFEIALQRCLTELMQGRSFEGMNEMPAPTFNEYAVKEHNNIIDHFIDSSGVISWKFFSESHEFDFYPWDFKGDTSQELEHLLLLLKEIKKDAYTLNYKLNGAYACRIIVPGYSEIYEIEDLVWDNSNRALLFREEILNLFELDKSRLLSLLNGLEEEELDHYQTVSELIGVAFDDSTNWGRLSVGELKLLIHLKLKNFDSANELIGEILLYSDILPARKREFKALSILLDIKVRSLKFSDYDKTLIKVYGKDLITELKRLINGEISFYGLSEISPDFKGVEKHLRLITSFRKSHRSRRSLIK